MGRREARDGEKKSFYFIFLGDLQSKTVSLRGKVIRTGPKIEPARPSVHWFTGPTI